MKLLAPLGILYGRVMDARNALYDQGVLKSYSLGAKTISVGNLTTGGTGKTPLVALIAEILAATGETVCILTRGYGRKNPRDRVLVSDGKAVLVEAEIGGDEPVELARKLIGKAIVVADADRVSAAAWAKEKFGVTAFILDDGFQHRRARRDLDIVCVDATNPCGNGRILPAGTLRESFKSLNRADAVVITRADLADDLPEVESRVRKRNSSALVFKAIGEIKDFVSLAEFHAETQRTQSEESPWQKLLNHKPHPSHDEVRISAFCAVGNPDAFFKQLLAIFEDRPEDEFDLAVVRPFPDHHQFRQPDIDGLEKQANECGIDVFVTTAKDAVKLKGLKVTLPCYVIETDMIIDDPNPFRELLLSV